MITQYPRGIEQVQLADGSQIDAFGRLRVGSPFGIFDSKQISTNDPYAWNELLVGTASDTYTYDRSSTYIAVGTASGDRAVRQTARYMPYIPGKSQQIVMTGIFGAGKTNVNQYIGYGDDLNGLFFKLQETTLGVVVRTATSGTALDTFVAQSSWNVDKMDGTGPSKVTLDITKSQIFVIDFQWLGVGRVRFSLDIDGKLYPVHQILNANSLSVVYMKTPTLPIRYEVVNTGTTSGATTMEQICCSVSSEGGYSVPGLEFSISNGITRRAVTTRTPILAVRLKTAFPTGEPNRRTLKLINFGASAITNNAYVEIFHAHDVTAVTATWNDVDDSSGAEYSVDISALTATHNHFIEPLTVMAGQAGKGGSDTQDLSVINEHSYVSQNFDSTSSQIFVMYATSEAGTSDVTAHISFVEID